MKSEDWDKIADKYHDIVVSPFQQGVQNPLLKKLKKIKKSNEKTIMDAGCGRGEILDGLALKFKKVYALDFSSKMIEIAKENNSAKNIDYFVQDIRDLSKFKEKCDVILSINSVLMPEINDVKQSISALYDSLKENGRFYGVFPSIESIIYHGFLILEDQLKEKDDEKMALANTKRIMERKKYDLIKGIYNDDGEEQKFFYKFELKLRLKDAGFKNIRIAKVLYPWKEGISDFEAFPDRPKMWDWFVTARKV